MKLSLISVLFLTLVAMSGCQTTNVPPVSQRVLTLATAEGLPRNGEGDLIKLKDGSIMIVYTEYQGSSRNDAARAHLVERRSTDGGVTWSAAREVFPREGKLNDMSVSLLRMTDGRIALFNLRKNSDDDCMPVVRYSSDEGRTWGSAVECLPASERDYYVLNNARAYLMKSGRVVLPLARHSKALDDKEAKKGRVSCTFSDDGGKTWRKGREYAIFNGEKRIFAQEPGLIELKDGRLCMYMRTNCGRQWQSFSSDGGDTWKDSGPSALIGPQSPATLRRLPDGRLIAVWNDHEGHSEYAEKKESWGRVPLTLAYSSDEGRSWKDRCLVESDLDGFYCYIATLFDGDDLLLHYYCSRPNLSASCVTRVKGALGYGGRVRAVGSAMDIRSPNAPTRRYGTRRDADRGASGRR